MFCANTPRFGVEKVTNCKLPGIVTARVRDDVSKCSRCQVTSRFGLFEENDYAMQVVGTMIGVAGNCTLSAVVRLKDDGHYQCIARAFDHPDPTKTLPSGTAARHVVTTEGYSSHEAARTLQDALVVLLGPLDWVRWNLTEGRQGR